MKKILDFGKISFTNRNRRANRVTVEVELSRKGGQEIFAFDPETKIRMTAGNAPEYMELSICGNIWNTRDTDVVMGGQCLDTIAEYAGQLQDKETFLELYGLWKKYHLNGMHAGTPEQEAAIEKWKAEGHKYDYDAVCEYLKKVGLYEVNYTGLAIGRRYDNEPYKYGHGWLVQELPEEVILKVRKIMDSH